MAIKTLRSMILRSFIPLLENQNGDKLQKNVILIRGNDSCDVEANVFLPVMV